MPEIAAKIGKVKKLKSLCLKIFRISFKSWQNPRALSLSISLGPRISNIHMIQNQMEVGGGGGGVFKVAVKWGQMALSGFK